MAACSCNPLLSPSELLGILMPQNAGDDFVPILQAFGLTGDIAMEISRGNMAIGWQVFSANVGSIAADTNVLSFKTEANVQSAALNFLGFTADNPKIAGIVGRARVYISQNGANVPTIVDVNECARSYNLRVKAGSNDTRIPLYQQVGTYTDAISDATTVAATTVSRSSHDGWFEDRVPPVLMQLDQDEINAIQTRRATTLSAALRHDVALYGVWFKNTGGDIRKPCGNIPPEKMAKVIAQAYGRVLQQYSAVPR